jgi:hypothetical protein
LWDAVTKRAKSFTGYTHQWRTCHDGFAAFCMASVDSVYEASEAQLAGYRTFRVRQVGGDVLRNEIICPASVEAGKRTTCENCILCAGNKTRSVKNIVIIAHGTGRKHVT